MSVTSLVIQTKTGIWVIVRVISNIIHCGGETGKKSFFPLCLLGLLLYTHAQAADLAKGGDPRLLAFEAYFAANVLPHVPGAALAIIADGKVELLKPYG